MNTNIPPGGINAPGQGTACLSARRVRVPGQAVQCVRRPQHARLVGTADTQWYHHGITHGITMLVPAEPIAAEKDSVWGATTRR
jgi:hypothetical protein